MKSIMVIRYISTIIAISLTAAPSVFAGSIDYLSNQGADFARCFRGAATDGADIVNYNPAGTAMMTDALYLQLNNQTIFKEYSVTSTAYGEYKSTYPTYFLPSLFAVYKKNNWSAFFGFTVPAGGGTVKYEKGLPLFYELEMLHGGGLDPDSMWLEGSSMYLAGTAGGAYAFSKKISLSIGLRCIWSRKTYEAEALYNDGLAKLDAEKKAWGAGGIFGLFFVPIDSLRIGLRYEMETSLEFETETKKQTLDPNGMVAALDSFNNGHREKRNLPALLGLGISYDITSNITASFSGLYYFVKQADKNKDVKGSVLEAKVVGYDDDYDNGLEIGVSCEYSVLPYLTLSIAYTRNNTGSNEDALSAFEFIMDTNTISGGIKYNVSDDLYLTLGLARVFYEEAEKYDGSERYNKSVTNISVAVQYRYR